MGAATKLNDFKALSNFTLLNALDTDKLTELTQKSTVKKFAAGASLPTKNHSNKTLFYLLSGTVEITRRGETEKIKAGHKKALSPICYKEPQAIAVAKSPISVMCVNTELLELLQYWDSDNSCTIEDINTPDTRHWVNALLKNKTLSKLSPNKLQSLIATIEPLETKQGEVIIKQDDSHNDNYYIISQGSCVVSRQSAPNNKEVELVKLNAGQAFGEEALISHAPRNANVTMSSDGLLLQINHQNFSHLLEKSFVTKVSYARAARMKEQGAETLDVRSEAAFINNGIGTHMPLQTLRSQAHTLDRSKEYVVVCEDGKKSAVATFFLSQQGFHVYALKGGLEAINNTKPIPATKEKIITIVKDEYAAEHLRWRACEMEQRIQRIEDKYQTEIKQLRKALSIEKNFQKGESEKHEKKTRQIKQKLQQEKTIQLSLNKQLKTEKTLFTKLKKQANNTSKLKNELKQKNDQLSQQLISAARNIAHEKQRIKPTLEEAHPFVYIEDGEETTNKLKYIAPIMLAALAFYAASYFSASLTEQLEILISSV